MGKAIFTNVNLDKLILDKNNSRFAELYTGSEKEEDLIEYLLYTESAEEIAKGILEAKEFYPDRPLWVLENGNNYLVRDGNRRCAAVKALQFPKKYGLNLSKFYVDKLPVLIYKNKDDLDKRIRHEHTANLFKEWDRIAKALEVYKLHSSGNSIESMKEIDSSPSDLIKLASFYYESVKIKGDDLKKLLRRGRGETGGKTVIFERLFRYRKLCGYNFKNGPSYAIDIFDHKKFSEYIFALVDYLKENPKITHNIIDDEKDGFLKRLKEFGFSPIERGTSKVIDKKTGSITEIDFSSEKKKRKTIKTRPDYERKKIPSPLEHLIKECFDLDENNFSNAKLALTRVVLECSLKYVLENTGYNSDKKISNSQFFRNAYFTKKGEKRNFTDCTELKNRFTEIILETRISKSFKNFDLERPHQIIHNYNVCAAPGDARAYCDNLISLIEFLLQDEKNLLKSLDLTKL